MNDCDRTVTKMVLESPMDRPDSDSAARKNLAAADDQRKTEEMKQRK